MLAQVITLNPPAHKAAPCPFKSSCPIYRTGMDDDPVAAIYSIITQSGRVLNGIHKVKERHINELLLALDRLTLRLHAELAEA